MSHTEGERNVEYGTCNHVEGSSNTVYASYTHSGGKGNIISVVNIDETVTDINDGSTIAAETSFVIGSGNILGKRNTDTSNSKNMVISGSNNIGISSVNSFVIGTGNVNTLINNSLISGTGNTQNNISNSVVSGKDNIVSDASAIAVFGMDNNASGSYVFSAGTGNIVRNEAEAAFGKYNNHRGESMFSVGIGSGDSNRKNAIEVTNTGDIFINYNQTKDQGKINVFAGASNINEATFIDQEGNPYTLLTYMSIQDVIDWLSSRINNLYDFVNKLKTDNNLN